MATPFSDSEEVMARSWSGRGEDIAEAMSQLAKIGSELLRPEDDRDPLWRSIPVAKEIMVTKGIATRAPWEAIQVDTLLW